MSHAHLQGHASHLTLCCPVHLSCIALQLGLPRRFAQKACDMKQCYMTALYRAAMLVNVSACSTMMHATCMFTEKLALVQDCFRHNLDEVNPVGDPYAMHCSGICGCEVEEGCRQHTCTGHNDAGLARVRHLAKLIRERPCGIDDLLCKDLCALSTESVFDFSTNNQPILTLENAHCVCMYTCQRSDKCQQSLLSQLMA